ncbi:MAG: hypothetical protein CFE37_09150 [Alphaproteobacteria bacterium PA4]|nr:MAG: hypothetical protein CFE37_09150 [Alphaproteobacteria bacterium PA4]
MSRPTAFAQAAIGIGFLCGVDVLIKVIARLDVPVPVITFGRYFTGTIVSLALWLAAGRPAITRAMLPAHLLRGVFIAIMASLFFWSLTKLPLAEAVTLSFFAPLLVPALGAMFLGEPMRGRSVAAGLIGFLGVIVTTQGAPSFSGDRLLAVGAVLVAGAAYAGSIVIMRARSGQDGPQVVTLLGAVIPLLLLSPTVVGAALPPPAALGWFVALGLVSTAGMQLLSYAYAKIEAQVLAVMEFTALPWAALFGWAVFGEPVRLQVWAGAAIILAACVWAGREAAPAEVTAE